ncbi:MAG: hypothetical protein IPJ65_24980 [Archangiaceae bacterium]|nr:hypothetical protein [Archangiaceae bacterium]
MGWTWIILLALSANPHLDEGKRLYEQLKYPEAEARLKVAAQSPTNTPEEQAQIADLLARALIAQGRAADAERTWAELLSKQPHAPDPAGASPKIREVFTRAKKSVYPDGFVKLERRPAAPGRYEADLVDPWNKVASVTLGAQALPDARHFAGALPPGTSVMKAFDVDGKGVATLEWTLTVVEQQPLVIAAPEVPQGPKRWPAVLTGVLAVGALGGGTALALLAYSDYQSVKPDTDAATTMRLDGSARGKLAGAYAGFGVALALGILTGILIASW